MGGRAAADSFAAARRVRREHRCGGRADRRVGDPRVLTVVSHGGRVDLAREAFAKARCPTLLVVGGNDAEVIELNRRAMQQTSAPTKLAIVPGAGHLFEEPGVVPPASRGDQPRGASLPHRADSIRR